MEQANGLAANTGRDYWHCNSYLFTVLEDFFAMTEYHKQYHAHNGASPIEGYCEFYNCKFTGQVTFTGDYMYLCEHHRKVMNAQNYMHSKVGTARYNASKIRQLREELVKLEAAQPDLDEKAQSAEFKYKLMIGKQ